MTRPALTKADWQAFGRAADKWADEAGGAEFRAAVEEIVRRRLVKAWGQGYDAGWSDGVQDATGEDNDVMRGHTANPY